MNWDEWEVCERARSMFSGLQRFLLWSWVLCISVTHRSTRLDAWWIVMTFQPRQGVLVKGDQCLNNLDEFLTKERVWTGEPLSHSALFTAGLIKAFGMLVSLWIPEEKGYSVWWLSSFYHRNLSKNTCVNPLLCWVWNPWEKALGGLGKETWETL